MSTIKKLRTRITSAHVIAMIALFVALSGSSYAAVTIRASQIRNNSIPGSKLKSGSIPATKLQEQQHHGRQAEEQLRRRCEAPHRRADPDVAGGGNLINPNSETHDGNSSSGSHADRRARPASVGSRGAGPAKGDTGATDRRAQGATARVSKSHAPAAQSSPTDGTTATATATCAAGSVLYAGNYATAATQALAVNATTSYVGDDHRRPGVRVDVFGLCAAWG